MTKKNKYVVNPRWEISFLKFYFWKITQKCSVTGAGGPH